MSDFTATVIQEIRRRGGVTFAEFMSWALYHPRHGYYTAGLTHTGRQGDFFTNAQAGPLFGEMMAEVILRLWRQLDNQHFTVLEWGGGDGRAAQSILRAFDPKISRGLTYILIEKSFSGRESARKTLSRFPRVTVTDTVEDLPTLSGVDGLIWGNEYLDALPVNRVCWREGRLWELKVVEKAGRLIEEPHPPSREVADLFQEEGLVFEEGQIGEVCPALADVVDEVDRCLGRGFFLALDYGGCQAEVYGPHHGGGTLQVTRRHQTQVSPFEQVGQRDLTAHVDFTRVARLFSQRGWKPVVFSRQGPFFLHAAPEALRRAVEASGATRVGEVQQLIHPQSFGGAFQVLLLSKNAGMMEGWDGPFNRLIRLGT